MQSLYNPKEAPLLDERGQHRMLSTCIKRLANGANKLVNAHENDSNKGIQEAIFEINPLLVCQHHNSGLPCATACFQTTSVIRTEFKDYFDGLRRVDTPTPPLRTQIP